MKKLLLIMASIALVGCQARKPHYESVNDYPVKSGSTQEVIYTPSKTTFSLWSPNADSVRLSLYETADAPEPIFTQQLKRRKDGSWLGAVTGDWQGEMLTPSASGTSNSL